MVKVIVSGLKSEENMFKESLIETATAAAEKLEKIIKFAPEDELHLQVKSHVEGKKKRFEVKARISANGTVYAAHEMDMDENRDVWDLHLAVKDALAELSKVVEKRARHPHLKGLTADEALEKRSKGGM